MPSLEYSAKLMKQKLVTVYLADYNETNLEEQEHLTEHLDDGWRIVSIIPAGAAIAHSHNTATYQESLNGYMACWLAILLER